MFEGITLRTTRAWLTMPIRPKGRRARTVPTDIPITTVDHFPKNRTCRGCGSEMPSIGSETTTRTILVPEHVKIVKEVYHRCACNKERCKDHGPVAAKSEHFIMRGRTLSAGLVVEAAIQKYHEHSTPYRMERRLSAQNLNISRSTLYRNIAHLAGFFAASCRSDIFGNPRVRGRFHG